MSNTSWFNKDEFKKNIISNCKSLFRKNIDEADKQQLFQSVAYAVKEIIIDRWIATQKEYAKQDKRIRIIQKENGGVSSARNCGIKEARGEYLQFVDSDDTIDKEMTQKLYEAVQKNEADEAIEIIKTVNIK